MLDMVPCYGLTGRTNEGRHFTPVNIKFYHGISKIIGYRAAAWRNVPSQSEEQLVPSYKASLAGPCHKVSRTHSFHT